MAKRETLSNYELCRIASILYNVEYNLNYADKTMFLLREKGPN